jgi:hypothetical protein
VPTIPTASGIINQAEIIKSLREVGAEVTDLSRFGQGFPDLCVGFRGVNYLLEVKTEHGKLTDAEVEWFHNWKGQAAVVRNVAEALWEIGAVECSEK